MILPFKKQFQSKILDGIKIHTVRDDKFKRWKGGRKIHYATGVRTKNYNEFKQGVCISTQDICMTYAYDDIIEITIGVTNLFGFEDREEFAKNDGFDDWASFFKWFYPLIIASPNESYTGTVIHWTRKRY